MIQDILIEIIGAKIPLGNEGALLRRLVEAIEGIDDKVNKLLQASFGEGKRHLLDAFNSETVDRCQSNLERAITSFASACEKEAGYRKCLALFYLAHCKKLVGEEKNYVRTLFEILEVDSFVKRKKGRSLTGQLSKVTEKKGEIGAYVTIGSWILAPVAVAGAVTLGAAGAWAYEYFSSRKVERRFIDIFLQDSNFETLTGRAHAGEKDPNLWQLAMIIGKLPARERQGVDLQIAIALHHRKPVRWLTRIVDLPSASRNLDEIEREFRKDEENR